MTPQERALVDELFDRLAKLENAPRDGDAERAIAEGARRAPHAVYALVQTALVQDEALKRANARIEELQAQASGGEAPQQQQGGFLDSMREAVFGRTREPSGSVPTVRPRDVQSPSAAASAYQPERLAPGYPPQAPYPGSFGGGGSFLGNAASTAAGVIGGALLLDGIRSMFGHHAGLGAHEQSAFGNFGDHASPWSGSAADSDLARQAGIDHIGDAAHHDAGEQQDRNDAGAYDAVADNNADDGTDMGEDDNDFADDDDFTGDDGSGGDTYDV